MQQEQQLAAAAGQRTELAQHQAGLLVAYGAFFAELQQRRAADGAAATSVAAEVRWG